VAAGYKIHDRYGIPARPVVATNDGNDWRLMPTRSLPDMYAIAIDAASPSRKWIGGYEWVADITRGPHVRGATAQ
jgi:hypothetical protein